MKYDASLIETDFIEIDGKKVKVEKIPTGMNGPNGPPPALSNFDDDFVDEAFTEDSETYRDFTDYVDEGIEPDSDEVRELKEEIESKQIQEILDLDTVDLEEEYEVEVE